LAHEQAQDQAIQRIKGQDENNRPDERDQKNRKQRVQLKQEKNKRGKEKRSKQLLSIHTEIVVYFSIGFKGGWCLLREALAMRDTVAE
jgi:hypothetical protein